jgi:hypothetical protein
VRENSPESKVPVLEKISHSFSNRKIGGAIAKKNKLFYSLNYERQDSNATPNF